MTEKREKVAASFYGHIFRTTAVSGTIHVSLKSGEKLDQYNLKKRIIELFGLEWSSTIELKFNLRREYDDYVRMEIGFYGHEHVSSTTSVSREDEEFSVPLDVLSV